MRGAVAGVVQRMAGLHEVRQQSDRGGAGHLLEYAEHRAQDTGEDRMIKLKPCPFCGSKDLVFGHEGDSSCCIGCANCGVRVGHYCEYMSDNEDIARLWNRRVEE